MRLPNAEQARVDRAKVVDYLLSTEHREGGPKAGFFLRFGFTREHWEDLMDALRLHAARHEVVRVVPTEHGVRYVLDGILETPDGRNPIVRTVWQIDSGDDLPRLISAYPD